MIVPRPTPDLGLLAHAPSHSTAVPQWGDMPTWLLAVIALGALIAAILAYLKQADAGSKLQADAGSKLADQVDLQRQALADQQTANAKLTKQVDLQRAALADQPAANAAQARVLEAELAELRQRAEAIARQQAD